MPRSNRNLKSNNSFQSIFAVILIIGIIIALAFIIQLSHKHELMPKPEGMIAFVIDDWGYSLKNVDLVLSIDRPITLSILPHLRYSKEIAQKIKENSRYHDIILHLPLESKAGKTFEPNTIKRTMKKDRILSILHADIEDLPGIVGVSNHQGSRITEDRIVMKAILEELKKQRLFFLDSRTTPVSVCANLAKNIGVKYAERSLFIDLTQKKGEAQNKAYTKRQIQELIKIAKYRGSAIGIGHDKKITLEAIKEIIPEIEKENVKIVPLKELAR